MRLTSSSSAAELIVVRSTPEAVDLAIDGEPLGQAGAVPGGADAGGEVSIQLGKRYTDDDGRIELLCIRAGSGTLTCDGRRMDVKGAQPLPSSD
jgi:hypothetical protein